MASNTTQIRCEDELTLQRLLDEELDADASELVFHHLKGCQRCTAVFQELKELKAFCESQMGLEDEAEAALSSATLERVRNAIESGNGRTLTAEVSESPAIDGTNFRATKKTSRIKKWFSSINTNTLLRPGFVTTVAAVLLIVVGLVFWLRSSAAVSAAELLRQSAEADDAIAAHSDQVLKRTINLEARVGQTAAASRANKPVWTRRIEVWRSAHKGQTARRLFDEQDRLVAGEWVKADGTRVLFREGDRLQELAVAQPLLDLKPETIWRLDVSAKDFAALIGNLAAARVEETSATYFIQYDGQPTDHGNLLRASLVLSKADLHTVEQTLVVKSPNSQFIEYRFSETSFERRTPNSVAPAVFEPDPAVLAATKSKDEGGRMKNEASSAAPHIESSSAPLVASTELEVEILEKLNRVNAFLGEQLSLTRTPEGRLLISGIVETSERKNEILRSLGDATRNAAIRIDVSTVAEAQQRQKRGRGGNLTVEDVQVSENSIPVETELRTHLTRKGFSATQLDREIERFSRRVLAHSARARSHALALKQIAERFSASDLEKMDQDALARWRALISQHAQFFRRELQQVRQELAPMFSASSTGGSTDIEIAGDKDVARAAKKLFELASATDNGLHRSFSLSAEGAGAAPVRSPQFWQSMRSAESLAEKLSS